MGNIIVINRNAAVFGATVSALAALILLSVLPVKAAAKTGQPFLAGVNLAGAEFGEKMPGERGTDYTYPTTDDIARYKKMGFNVIRLPFRWERLQPDIFGNFNETEWQHIEGLIQAAEKAKVRLILDVHNYARRKLRKDGFKKDWLIGSKTLPTKAFTHFWKELATRTMRYPGVIYGLMNEPFDMPAKDWRGIAQSALNVIRATGAQGLVLVPGVAWSGAHSWMGDDTNNRIMSEIIDPIGHMAFEVHQYLDTDSSGTNPKAVSRTIGTERLQAFQEWARKHKARAFLGEFGSGKGATGLAAMAGMLKEVSKNRDIWIGWTAWAAGPWWPDDDKFSLEQDSKGKMRKQTKLLRTIAKKQLAK